jgi:hypothetical protein
MKIGVCGIACEICPKMASGKCPNGQEGCKPKENKFCQLATCAFRKGMKFCFQCVEFPCELTRSGPISYGYGSYLKS